jgi:hypothetical protein
MIGSNGNCLSNEKAVDDQKAIRAAAALYSVLCADKWYPGTRLKR